MGKNKHAISFTIYSQQDSQSIRSNLHQSILGELKFNFVAQL